MVLIQSLEEVFRAALQLVLWQAEQEGIAETDSVKSLTGGNVNVCHWTKVTQRPVVDDKVRIEVEPGSDNNGPALGHSLKDLKSLRHLCQFDRVFDLVWQWRNEIRYCCLVVSFRVTEWSMSFVSRWWCCFSCCCWWSTCCCSNWCSSCCCCCDIDV